MSIKLKGYPVVYDELLDIQARCLDYCDRPTMRVLARHINGVLKRKEKSLGIFNSELEVTLKMFNEEMARIEEMVG